MTIGCSNLLRGRTVNHSLESLVAVFGIAFACRFYGSRGLRRNPIKVLVPDDHTADNHAEDASERIRRFPVLKPKLEKRSYIFNEEMHEEENQESEEHFAVNNKQETVKIPHYVKLGDDVKLLS